jgi:hypothetical protein
MGVLVTRHRKPLKDQDARLGAKAGRDRSCGAMRGKEFCPKEKEIQRAERGLRSSRLRRPIAATRARFQDFVAGNRDQNLLSHFGEAGTAVLAVKQVEYGGHENPRLIITVDVPRDRFWDHHR